MITKDKLPEFIRTTLGEDNLKRPGGVLYSSHETLREGVAYIVGFNPGGEPSDNTADDPTVGGSVDKLLEYKCNAYLDEDWGNGARFRRSVECIAEQLGLQLRDICASNLVFFQSRNAEGVRPEDAKLCWPVHDAILQIVKPRIIIALGYSEATDSSSSFKFFHAKFAGSEIKRETLEQSGKEYCFAKRFDATIHGSKVVVAGLPHPTGQFTHWIDSPDIKAEIEAWLKGLKKIVNP
ncbi:MAG: uracil-DNA glycosylase family protein [Helicobacteraceae bacterium]|jgi:uracil-DNA glycosylase|nr:uracil-DNA glycosylase family protein [Helicobacteraceae bacterium]